MCRNVEVTLSDGHLFVQEIIYLRLVGVLGMSGNTVHGHRQDRKD